MDKFIIKGAGKKLKGTIVVGGSKNTCLKIMAASLLTKKPLLIQNVPLIKDVFQMNELLKNMGAEVRKIGNNALHISTIKIKNPIINKEIAKLLRASIVLTGPILVRFGEVSFPYPGGCVIGKRPIDVFLDGFKKMGATVSFKKSDSSYLVKAGRGGLRGAEIFFKMASVTGTETLMMAATLARGRTTIRNAAQEPEVESLAQFLNQSGARISGAGTNTIIIDGVKKLKGGKFKIPSDRIEAGSFLILGALLGQDLKIMNCNPEHMISVIDHLESMGVKIKKEKTILTVSRPKVFLPINIKTHEYPGFPTDLQAPFSVLLSQANGRSILFETIFEGRLGYVNDLERMGAKVTTYDTHRVGFYGPAELRGREMETPDLRAGLAFIIAALVAKGRSIIYNVYNIDRGYERIEERLQKVGASIKRVA